MNLGRDSEARFGQYLEFSRVEFSRVEFSRNADVEILKLVLGQYSEDEI